MAPRGRGVSDSLAPAVRVAGACQDVFIAGNQVDGGAQRAGDVKAPAGAVGLRRPKKLPEIDPSALPPNGARHLGIAKLDPRDEKALWPG